MNNWGFPTSTWFGKDRLKDLPKALTEIEARNPLVVTDAGLVDLPVFKGLIEVLCAAAIPHAVFADIRPNPTGEDVAKGVLAAQAGAHDGVIILGGGSALDAGKAIAFMIGQERPIWDFEDIGDNWRRGQTERTLPVIAIPTTAGTGSEFGRASVITDISEQPHRKVIVFHPSMMPELVIMDPVATQDLPPALTAATGMDALSHALEAFCVDSYHPMSDGLSLQALTMIARALPLAYRDGANFEARADMLVASGMACVALQKGLGGMHAISHALGAVYDAHHGLLNAVLMPHVLKANQSRIHGKLASLAQHLQLGSAASDFLSWLADFRAELAIPDSLETMGLTDIDTDLIARMAVKDPCAAGNPVEMDVAFTTSVLHAAL